MIGFTFILIVGICLGRSEEEHRSELQNQIESIEAHLLRINERVFVMSNFVNQLYKRCWTRVGGKIPVFNEPEVYDDIMASLHQSILDGEMYKADIKMLFERNAESLIVKHGAPLVARLIGRMISHEELKYLNLQHAVNERKKQLYSDEFEKLKERGEIVRSYINLYISQTHYGEIEGEAFILPPALFPIGTFSDLWIQCLTVQDPMSIPSLISSRMTHLESAGPVHHDSFIYGFLQDFIPIYQRMASELNAKIAQISN
jgi:hypothetical protein